jgi:hypothetical protein
MMEETTSKTYYLWTLTRDGRDVVTLQPEDGYFTAPRGSKLKCFFRASSWEEAIEKQNQLLGWDRK